MTHECQFSPVVKLVLMLSHEIPSGADPGFGQGGGPQVLRLKVADVAKRAICGRGPGSFWVFNAQICILPHSRDSFSLIFDIYFNTKS